MMGADAVFYTGLMLEGRMADDFALVGRKGKPVFPVTEGLDREKLREPPEFEGHWDPHVWMDVELWSECVSQIASQLKSVDETAATKLETKATELEAQEEKDDAEISRLRSRATTYRERAKEYAAPADEYRKRLTELDSYIRKVIDTIPKEPCVTW